MLVKWKSNSYVKSKEKVHTHTQAYVLWTKALSVAHNVMLQQLRGRTRVFLGINIGSRSLSQDTPAHPFNRFFHSFPSALPESFLRKKNWVNPGMVGTPARNGWSAVYCTVCKNTLGDLATVVSVSPKLISTPPPPAILTFNSPKTSRLWRMGQGKIWTDSIHVKKPAEETQHIFLLGLSQSERYSPKLCR